MTERNKKIFWWAAYDFANSLAFINISFYFALWFVTDLGGQPSWISFAVVSATILLLFTLPPLGNLSDHLHRRMPFLIFFTLAAIGSLAVMGILAIQPDANTMAIQILVLYFLFQYCYQGSLAFYDGFLRDLGSNRMTEKISGLGLAAGQIGNIVGILLIFPIATGAVQIMGLSGRSVTFIIAAFFYLIFALPVLIHLKDRPTPKHDKEPTSGSHNPFASTINDLKNIHRYPGLLNYLITYYLFADALLTLQLFATLYADIVFGLTDVEKVLFSVLGLSIAALGAFISPYIVSAFHSTRKTISFFIGSWAVLLIFLALAFDKTIFIILTILNGFAFGVLFSLSRAYFSELVPANRQSQYFSIYVLFERFASVLGPIVWSGTLIYFAHAGVLKYRYAMIALGLLVVASFIVFQFGADPQLARARVKDE